MKLKNKICIYPLIIMGFVLMLVTGCDNDKNSDEDSPDYASEIAGTYTGTVTLVGTGTVPCSSKLTRSSNTKVDLEIKIGTNNIPLDGINVSSSEDDIYDLKLTDSSGSFTGEVDGNKLTWTLISGDITETFSGTK